MENPDFLKRKYNLQNTPEVESAVEGAERHGEKISQKPKERIQTYLDRLQAIIDPESLEGHEDFDRKERNLEMLRRSLHNQFVIKQEEIPEAYFDNQRRLAREQGHGDVEIPEETRDQLSEVIIADQQGTLDNWVEYLSSSDAMYPDWLKYWAIRSILSLSSYDKEKHEFGKRGKGTTAPFPDINREALAYVLDAVEKKHQGQTPGANLEGEDKQKFEEILQSENFAKLYAWAIEKVTPASQEALIDTRGEWVKYEQGADHMPLVRSLQSHGTGWCTAGESTAQSQLSEGDFHVYYTLDQDGKPTIPRVAIRMEQGSIAEVRGVAHDQNLDPYISPVVQEKLKEFPDGKAYEKKSADMTRLTAIEQRTKAAQPLTKEDLLFLYEIDSPIQGFGYKKDPRIKELLEGRDVKADISEVTGYDKEEISTTEKEALSGGIKFHFGDLNLNNLTTAEGLTLPTTIGGSLYLHNLTTAEGLTLPTTIGGDLVLSNLTTAEGLTLPTTIGRDLVLHNLTTAEGLTLPTTIGGDLVLSNLTTAEGLTLPTTIGGSLYLNRLTTAEITMLRTQYPELRII